MDREIKDLQRRLDQDPHNSELLSRYANLLRRGGIAAQAVVEEWLSNPYNFVLLLVYHKMLSRQEMMELKEQYQKIEHPVLLSTIPGYSWIPNEQVPVFVVNILENNPHKTAGFDHIRYLGDPDLAVYIISRLIDIVKGNSRGELLKSLYYPTNNSIVANLELLRRDPSESEEKYIAVNIVSSLISSLNETIYQTRIPDALMKEAVNALISQTKSGNISIKKNAANKIWHYLITIYEVQERYENTEDPEDQIVNQPSEEDKARLVSSLTDLFMDPELEVREYVFYMFFDLYLAGYITNIEFRRILNDYNSVYNDGEDSYLGAEISHTLRALAGGLGGYFFEERASYLG